MKTKFYTIVMLMVFGLSSKKALADACAITQLSVTSTAVPYYDALSNTTKFTFTLAYNAALNGGSKYSFIHLWPSNLYGGCTYSNPNPAPAGPCLANCVAIIVIDNNEAQNSSFVVGDVLQDTYGPDATKNSLVLSDLDGLGFTTGPAPTGYVRYFITNIVVSVPGNVSLSTAFKGDVWASNASNGNVVHCVNKDFNFLVNDPAIVAAVSCRGSISMTASTYTVDYSYTLSSISLLGTQEIKGNIRVYKDVDNNGTFSPGTDAQVDEILGVTLNSLNSWSVSGTRPYTMTNLPSDATRKLFIQFENGFIYASPTDTHPSEIENALQAVINMACVLPINLKSFAGTRINKEDVLLKWSAFETTTQDKYELQRSEDGRNWAAITSVQAKFDGGKEVFYAYTDKNNSSKYTLYRLKMINNDGKSNLSNVVNIPGTEKPFAYAIAPNPSTDGRIQVRISSNTMRLNIFVVDNLGRIINRINNVLSGNYIIDKLQNGVYYVKIANDAGDVSTIDKVVIQR